MATNVIFIWVDVGATCYSVCSYNLDASHVPFAYHVELCHTQNDPFGLSIKIYYITTYIYISTVCWWGSTHQLIANNCKKHCVTHVPQINFFKVMHRTIAVNVLLGLVPSRPKTLAVRGPKHLGQNHHCHKGSNWDSMATFHSLYWKRSGKGPNKKHTKAHLKSQRNHTM